MSEYYSIAPYSAELYHHGVKGQKWGVRRFQNADGSLTAAGKRREAKNSVKAAIRAAKGYDNDLNPDYVKARQHMKKAAVDDPSATQYDDPFYSVNKRTGEIKPFSPILNLKKFAEAQRTRLPKGGGL